MPKLIIGLCGLQGCGKGTVADILRKDYGADYFRFSKIMGDLLDRLALDKSREHFISVSEAMRHTFGEDVFSYAIEKDLLASTGEIAVLDGIRRIEDIVALEQLPQFRLVAIDADAKLRFERMKHRGEKVGETDMSWREFLEDEQAPTEKTIPNVMERAWRTVPNNEGMREFTGLIHEMMRDLTVSLK